MENEMKGLNPEIKRENHGERCDRRGGRGHQGAKTFRRGRALAFYEKLIVKRDTLKQQLESHELQSIQQVIAGELKATESIMNDFKAAFELEEISLAGDENKKITD
ncbi:2-keto-3-deoxygluconate kinase [Ureibacillus aquaedulcis]|uniref:2-keto-3-deoxygluconate kinase n=1 Tax=Ureibacillus aquaedulcis TaxID=3058421 RepID=A0ABT8GRE7_9BACL|nr:2-keto-3-deoxygluconate kinase [Ureibacillus sp. BA0131]MDN4493975.1 2-keto-3-deoxygluconate kinase [Ureibacillus sp. BA0131]